MVWQIGVYVYADADGGMTSFWEVYGFMVEAALVPVIVRPRLLYTILPLLLIATPGYLSDCYHHPRRAQQVAN